MTAAGVEFSDPERPDLRSRVMSGFLWKIASQGVTQVLKTVTVIVLARLLAPRDFGVAAMALVASAFVVTYSDGGLGLALVQKKSIDDLDCNSVFWASSALGLLMAAICFAVAPLVASFYHTAEVKPLLEVLSLSFLFTGLGSTHRSLHLRSMHFRVLEIRTMASGVIGGLVTVGVAVAGGGAWAFILGDVTGAAISTILLVAMGGWWPRFTLDWHRVRELGAFGMRYIGGTTFLTLNGTADNILIGRALGDAALGVYGLAYSVILVPLSRLAQPIHQLLSPAFARLQSDTKALGDAWLRATRLLLMLFLPLMITIAVTSPDIVNVLFGEKWQAAVPVMRILAPVCALISIQGVVDAVIQAVGEMKIYLRMCGVSFAFTITAFIIGLHWGVVGVAAGFAIAITSFMLVYVTLVLRKIHASGWRFAKAVADLAMGGIALAAVEVVVFSTLSDTSVGPLVRIAATTIAGVVTFGLFCLWRDRDSVVDLIRLATERLPGSRRFLPQALQSA
jgi:O-antigen/teichoic acid export membrane protein